MADDRFWLGLDQGMLLQHGWLGLGENAIEAAEHGERQDDASVFVPFVRAAEQIADAPNEIGDLGVGFGGHERRLISRESGFASIGGKADVLSSMRRTDQRASSPFPASFLTAPTHSGRRKSGNREIGGGAFPQPRVEGPQARAEVSLRRVGLSIFPRGGL